MGLGVCAPVCVILVSPNNFRTSYSYLAQNIHLQVVLWGKTGVKFHCYPINMNSWLMGLQPYSMENLHTMGLQ